MHTKPIHTLAVIAALLVGWLSLRMWCGHIPAVWSVSCLLGAWSPFFGGLIWTYIAAIGHRESGVGAAWLVRAIGMHFALLWLLGMTDLLRGDPFHHHHGTRVELLSPLVMLLFFPLVGLAIFTSTHVVRTATRLGLTHGFFRPITPGESDTRVAPFRGLLHRWRSSESLPVPLTTWGIVSVACALLPMQLGWTVILGSAALVALSVVMNPRGFAPALFGLGAVGGGSWMILTHRLGASLHTSLLWLPLALVAMVLLFLVFVHGFLSLDVRRKGFPVTRNQEIPRDESERVSP